MSFATFRWVQRFAALGGVAWLAACEPKERPNRGDRTERPLDNLERAAARTVATETAATAMQERDLKKLKMLSVWVRNRAEVVLMAPEDLKALDLAIECLEGTRPVAERDAALDEIQGGKLKAPTRELCLEEKAAEE